MAGLHGKSGDVVPNLAHIATDDGIVDPTVENVPTRAQQRACSELDMDGVSIAFHPTPQNLNVE